MDIAAVAASAKRKAYINIVIPLFITSVIAFVDRVNIGYAALTMNKDMGFTAQVFGMGAGIFFAGYVLFEIPGALIAEKYSPRIWIARIMITWGIVCSLMAFMRNETDFYIARFLLGAAEASLYPVIYATCIPRWFAPEDRARAIAVLLTSLQISSIIGAPLAGWFLGLTVFGLKGWQALFFLEGVPAIIFGLIIVRWMADRPSEAKWLTDEEKRYLTDRYENEIAAKTAVKKYTVMQALSDPEVLKMCFAYFMIATGFWGFNYWMPQVVKAVSGWSNLAIGLLTIIPMVASLLFSLYIGHSSSKRNEKRWHGAICPFLGAIGLGVGAFQTDAFVSFFFVILAAMGTYGVLSVWWSYPTTFLSGAAAAGAVGLINSFGNIGGFVGPYITGWIKGSTGSFTTAWVYLAGCLVIGGLIILTFRKNLPTDAVKADQAVRGL